MLITIFIFRVTCQLDNTLKDRIGALRDRIGITYII